MNGKIPEGQVYAPRLEPMAPIRLADRNHAHYPSCHCTIAPRWCNGVMDSVRGFCLLGESVPQVRVSARTLALRGFFHSYFSDSLLLSDIYIFFFLENTLGECRINIFDTETRKRTTTGERKNDHRNPAGNRESNPGPLAFGQRGRESLCDLVGVGPGPVA